MKNLKVSLLALSLSVLGFSPAFAEHEVVRDERASQAPERVYVETDNRSYRTEHKEECFYNKAHGHLHCFEEDRAREPQVTYIETPHARTYRTRYVTTYRDNYHNPVSTGIAIGLGIGIPILLHNSFSHHGGHHYRRRHHGGHH